MTPVAAARARRSARNEIVGDPRSRGEGRVGKAAYSRITWLALAALPLLAIAVVGPMFAAQLGAIDDHEIPLISGLLREHGYLVTLADRADEANGRFRPLYWVGRVAETAVWGEGAGGWYLDRLMLVGGALAAGYALARLWFRPELAVLFAALIVVGPQAEAFYRLGPQEAYAVPITLAGLALVGRRRVAIGLGLLAAAALAKEPFVAVLIAGVGWAWWLGHRRAAVVGAAAAVAITGAIGLAIVANGGDYYGAQGLQNVPFSGRYLYPWIVPAALAVTAVAQRFRWLAAPLVLLIGWNLVGVRASAESWATTTRTFSAFLAELRADPRPLFIVVRDPWRLEPAVAIRRYLPDRSIAAMLPAPFDGFEAMPRPGCLEIDIDGPPTGRCSATVTAR